MILDSIETKKQILLKFLELVPFEGWSEEALRSAVKSCRIDEKFQGLIFENGCLDLAEFYIDQKNQESAALISKKFPQEGEFEALKIREKIAESLYSRFEVEKDNKIILQRLVNFYLDPKNFASFHNGPRPLFYSLRSCYKIADFMWYNIADTSTDFNFYTKRLTLSKIIVRCLYVFLKDESESFEKTKGFIDSQIEKVMKFEKRKAQAKKIFSKAAKNLPYFFLDEDGSLKKPQEFVKSLPFIRLFKF